MTAATVVSAFTAAVLLFLVVCNVLRRVAMPDMSPIISAIVRLTVLVAPSGIQGIALPDGTALPGVMGVTATLGSAGIASNVTLTVNIPEVMPGAAPP